MDVSSIPLFALADRRLAWIDARQSVLAQNIANADTPGWRGRDLKPFAATLSNATLGLTRTDPGHLGPSPSAAALAPSVNRGESGPDGNGVSMDQELVKVADTDAAHELVTNVTKKYLGMFRTAIGH
jgi:flagellar basal-body rod protein FlgB